MTVSNTPSRFFLIRGLARESRHWGQFLSRMAKGFPNTQLLSLDTPGTGRYHSHVAPTSIHDYVEIMRQNYPSHSSPGDQCGVIGLSLGGMIATQWLDNHPEDFGSAVLINSSCTISPFYKRMSPSGGIKLLKSLMHRDPLQAETILASLLCNTSDTRIISRQWAKIRETAPVSLHNTLRQLFAAMTFRPPRKLNVPTLVLCSEQDRLVSPSCSRDIASYWQKTILCHQEAGHDLPTDAPDWCVSALQSWYST